MRLIDADEFEKRIKPYDTTDVMDKALYNFAHNQVICMPTVCDIEQIRDEIKHLLNRPSLTHVIGYDKGFVDGIDKVLKIIDKYKGIHK
jgi:hypothetical protein